MDEKLTYPSVQGYLAGLVPPRPPELIAMEADAAQEHFPIIGPAAGQLCYLLTRVAGARRVFELGSGSGYSTAWFARAVRENGGGVVHHVVWDEVLSRRARQHLARLGYSDLVVYHVDEAIAALRKEEGPFDVIFLDIDKPGYPAALPVIRDRLRSGGLLIADNLLWHGRIFDLEDRSEATESMRAFACAVTGDETWIASLLPIRDGLLVARRA